MPKARDYQSIKPKLMPFIGESFERLKSEVDIVLVEGAGSASEINLRKNDIANMGFARAMDVPVVLIGDIDRGGVIASLVGTKMVIDPQDAAMIEAFIINKMRGDPTLFDEGLAAITEKTGWSALGILPYFDGAIKLPAEDAFELAERAKDQASGGSVRIAVPMLPRIANFDDFDPLAAEPDVELHFVEPGEPIPAPCDLIILPGSKATIADLAALRRFGWDIDIIAHHRRGGCILGICGGYQMLGKRITDPDGIEGAPTSVDGLGFLDVETILTADKNLTEVTGSSLLDGAPFAGYEMHVGRTAGADTERPLLSFSDGRKDGARSADGRHAGTYVHGLFADDRQRDAWLKRLGSASKIDAYDAGIDTTLDALADHIETHLDLNRLLEIAR